MAEMKLLILAAQGGFRDVLGTCLFCATFDEKKYTNLLLVKINFYFHTNIFKYFVF